MVKYESPDVVSVFKTKEAELLAIIAGLETTIESQKREIIQLRSDLKKTNDQNDARKVQSAPESSFRPAKQEIMSELEEIRDIVERSFIGKASSESSASPKPAKDHSSWTIPSSRSAAVPPLPQGSRLSELRLAYKMQHPPSRPLTARVALRPAAGKPSGVEISRFPRGPGKVEPPLTARPSTSFPLSARSPFTPSKVNPPSIPRVSRPSSPRASSPRPPDMDKVEARTVDKLMEKFLVHFEKGGSGVYSFGGKRVCVVAKNGRPMIRQAGAFVDVDKFVKPL